MKPLQTHKVESYSCGICKKRLKRHKMPTKMFFNDIHHSTNDHSLELWSNGNVVYNVWITNDLVCEFSGPHISDPYRNILVKNTKTNFKRFYYQKPLHQSWSIPDWTDFIKNDLIIL